MTTKWLGKMTLDSFSRITHYNPLVFQGVKIFGKCDPLDPLGRESIVEAFSSSFNMMDALATRRGKAIFDSNCVLESMAPHFDLDGYQDKILTETTYSASIAYPITQHKQDTIDIATLTVTINALDATLHETLSDAQVSFDPLKCRRFGVSWLTTPSLAGVTLTLKAKAHNFIDIDNITDPANPPFLTHVDVVVTTIKDSLPLIYWPVGYCDNSPTCTYITTEGCLIPIRDRGYDVRYSQRCVTPFNYSPFPVKFGLPAVRNGCWMDMWQDGMVSLANTLITEDYGSCQPLVNERWEDDQGRGSKWEKTYRYSFWNPFGIAAPGAQKCWKQMEMTLGSSVTWNG